VRTMTTAMGLAALLVAMVAAGMAGAGCTKDEGPTSAGSASAVTASPTPAPTPAPTSTPTDSTTVSASATPIPTPIPTASGSAKPVASAKPAATCGDKPMPPCPLYGWMKANTSAAMSAQDFDALAVALDKVVGFAPAGYGNWRSIAKDGANAARAQSLDGVKASCRGCHNQYKDKYKKEMRDRPI